MLHSQFNLRTWNLKNNYFLRIAEDGWVLLKVNGTVINWIYNFIWQQWIPLIRTNFSHSRMKRIAIISYFVYHNKLKIHTKKSFNNQNPLFVLVTTFSFKGKMSNWFFCKITKMPSNAANMQLILMITLSYLLDILVFQRHFNAFVWIFLS